MTLQDLYATRNTVEILHDQLSSDNATGRFQ